MQDVHTCPSCTAGTDHLAPGPRSDIRPVRPARRVGVVTAGIRLRGARLEVGCRVRCPRESATIGAGHSPATESLAAPVGRPGPAVFAMAMGGFAIGTTEFVTMGLLPQVADGVGVSIPSAGHLISAYAIGVVVGAPLLAFLGARLSRRGLLIG